MKRYLCDFMTVAALMVAAASCAPELMDVQEPEIHQGGGTGNLFG